MAKRRQSIECNPELFPAPAQWATWIEDLQWDYQTRRSVPTGTGKFKQHLSFAQARRAVGWIGSASSYRPEDERGRYVCDWAIFEWVDGRWVERFAGARGQHRKHNALSKVRLSKKEQRHPIDVNEEEAVMAALAADMQKILAENPETATSD